MKRTVIVFALLAVSVVAIATEDPLLWLEEVEGKRAIEWVQKENNRSLAALEKDPRFNAIYQDALRYLTQSDRLPEITVIGQSVYDLLRDKDHTYGLWRRMPVTDYVTGKQEWEPVIDVDALAKADGVSWVFGGARCVMPTNDRCMISLSPGGTDASVSREFDLKKKEWVVDGFQLPELKTWLAWGDRDTLLVTAADRPDDLTTSGYGRVARVWKRGTPFSEAEAIRTVAKVHMGASMRTIVDGNRQHVIVSDRVTIFQPVDSLYVDGKLIDLGLPEPFRLAGVHKGQAIGRLQQDWKQGDRVFKQGALISLDLAALKKGTLPKALLVFEPSKRQSINMLLGTGLYTTDKAVFFSMMDDVRGRLLRAEHTGSAWRIAKVDFPDNGVIRLVAGGDKHVFATFEDMLTPPAQWAIGSDGTKQRITGLEPRMDTAGLAVEQRFATSKDGTRVPYFIARPSDWTKGKPVPTLMAAYGGFGFSSEPGYLGGFWGGQHSKTMLQSGGSFVLANIRGGAEYGPSWHWQGTLKNRQRVYDDFHAIAEDLIANGYTTSKQLGIFGASNSGLLMGVAFTQRPDLYNAVLCGVPLLDMKRYHLLLAGASWIGEYGNPDDPEMWEVIKTYSPYHNLHADRDYPEVFFFTSTKDDRVHPGHARKMAALMAKRGHDFLYFENIEGGHGAAASLKQEARLGALQSVYLLQQLEMAGPPYAHATREAVSN